MMLDGGLFFLPLAACWRLQGAPGGYSRQML